MKKKFPFTAKSTVFQLNLKRNEGLIIFPYFLVFTDIFSRKVEGKFYTAAAPADVDCNKSQLEVALSKRLKSLKIKHTVQKLYCLIENLINLNILHEHFLLGNIEK